MTTPLRTPGAAGLLATVLLSGCALAGCSGDETPDPAPTSSADAAISADRCAQNKAAGKITYVTGYQYQASASILEPVAAQALGYFEDVCLDVEIQPGAGATATNAQLVAAGTAQLSSMSGQSDVLVNVANGVDVKAIATFGHVPIATLMTEPDITDLKQLEGTTLGQKGALPIAIKGMLLAAGVDLTKVREVTVGFDPSVLVRGQVQSLTGYKSNEPLTLAAMGEDVKLWNPEDYEVPGSIATTIVNPDFLTEHRSAVEDFMRAQLHAYDYCKANGDECVGYAAKLSQAGYDTQHNVEVWKAESGLVDSSQPDGEALGTVDESLMRTEADFLVQQGQIGAVPDLAALIDPNVIPAIYSGSSVSWPAP